LKRNGSGPALDGEEDGEPKAKKSKSAKKKRRQKKSTGVVA